ncbi:MAG: hypothetical protein H0V81_09135 [Solirubrobacterales bacterium]|nr:hypothetical protein [Solirubrobacterales bacterium]
MFEQESYNQEPTELRTEPGDLFHDYEIVNWNFSPRLYKIIVISAIFNVLMVVGVGTTGLLTARGCDSPFVGRVCQVLNTVYVGSLIFGTDSEYADVDYTKTELGDAEVTFVDVTGVAPPLSYPGGYFQLANPEQQVTSVTDPMMSTPGFLAPGIPSGNPTYGGSGLINTPPIAARKNPNAIQGDLPTGSPLGDPTDNPTIAGVNRKGRRGQTPLDGGTPNDANANSNPGASNTNTANPTIPVTTDEAKEDQNGIFINKRPMRVEAKESLEQIDAGKVKIDTPFKVVISATLGLGKDGKTVVLKNPKPVPQDPKIPNDPVMEKFVQDWIIAVGDAGWFGYLDKLKAKKVLITVQQTDTELIASVRADQPTDNDAKLAASGLGTLLSIAAPAASGDDQLFLQKASVTAEGKTFILNFNIPKPLVQEMILRKLAESKEKEVKREGNALVQPSNNTAER